MKRFPHTFAAKIKSMSAGVLLTATSLCTICSCYKADDNGALGGNWQLTEWKRLSDGAVMADKNSRIFYTVQAELIKFQQMNSSVYYLATFHRTKDSLVIDRLYHSPIDTLVPYSRLDYLGMDSTGRFKIEKMTSQRLVMKNAVNSLTFRKF